MVSIRRRKSNESNSNSTMQPPRSTDSIPCVVALASPVASSEKNHVKKLNGSNNNITVIASPFVKTSPDSVKKVSNSKDLLKKPSSVKIHRHNSNVQNKASPRRRFYHTSILIFLPLLFLLGLAFMGVLKLSMHPSRNPNSISNVFAPVSDRILDRVSDSEIFLNPLSPQSRAKAWVLSGNGPATVQRYILAVIYFSLQGDGWRQRKGWLNPISECYWKGITCNIRKEVTMLWLTDNFLVGALPLELAHLSALDTLTLNDNEISGTLPSPYFTQLTDLRQISLYNNRLSGTIPEEMYDLSSLEYIGLQENILHGTISSKIGKLKSMHTFYLHGNRLTGMIPKEIVYADSSVEIALEDNFLFGALPSKLDKLQKLRWLSVQHNKLTGSIPDSLSQIASLKTLYLYNNDFYGTVPQRLCLNADFNDFYTDCGGNFPKVICSCCTACCSGDGCFKVMSMSFEDL